MRLTWWGHASCTVELAGLRVLADPVLTGRLAHLTRVVPPVAAAAAVADVVVLSHLHPDHLHLPSLRLVPASARIVAPRGAADLLARHGLAGGSHRLDEVDPGDVVRIGALEIHAVPAEHDGRRLPGSGIRGPALGYVLTGEGARVWFAGDTGLFDAMSGIGPVDVALVPVGGWGPTLGPHHLDPDQAVEAVRRTGAHDAVPIHFGTFWPLGLRTVAPAQFEDKCLSPGRRFADALAGSGLDARAHVLSPGSSVELHR